VFLQNISKFLPDYTYTVQNWVKKKVFGAKREEMRGLQKIA
jgi:hypothetical protein